jgi:antitoxin (DNA-binding transcriptional repressor) of toxin-antitoxin stability system
LILKAVSFRISCFLSEKYKVNAVLDICQKQHIINLAKIAKGADWNGGIILTQVNMLEAKTDLSKLVRMLETKEEDVIYLARNGTAVVQMTLIPKSSCQKRIGAAEGKFKIPDEFDAWDKEIEEMFGGEI